MDKKTKKQVQTYYGKILRNSKDLKTNACCTNESVSPYIKSILADIEPEILEKFYGCGSPIPQALEGCRVVDVGCGTGRDTYIVSRMVGSNGFVIGVDMTDEQLEVARKHLPSQMKRFGYKTPNIDFRKGYIEDLAECGIDSDSVDVVISNCVINLSPAKQRVFSEIFRILKPGGELYFSDIFSDRRIPETLHRDPVLYGECLGGALYIEDFRRLLQGIGIPDCRVVTQRAVSIENPEIQSKTGMVNFYSMTIRAFKLDNLEDICEDYGQAAVYLGSIANEPHSFMLDDHHVFYTSKPMLVCGNTAAMISETRYSKHFKIMGDRSVHFGRFNCTMQIQNSAAGNNSTGSACC
jgi:SAM-dependent methyltransferase